MESAEKTKDSRLARQLIVALPVELGRDDWLLLLRGFIQTECVDKGMCADFAIHDPDGHNPHAHIMLTMRPLDVHGKWQGKTQKEYLCRKADEERGFTAQEFLQAKENGWEKQYKYKNTAGVSAWLTPTQAAREPGWKRCSKQPKAVKLGRQNPLCARWNSPEQLLDWREAWADAVNRTLEEKQQSVRVTHLSHAALGLDEQPTVHEGSQARNLELQGIKADRCELNRQIRADNKLLRELKAQLAKQIAALTEKIEELRSRQAMILHNLDCKNNGEAQRFGSYLDKLEEMQEKLAAQRESLTQQLSATIKQYLEIENMIQPEDEDSVRQRRTALRPDVAFEREQQLSHNGYIDNISIQIAQQIVDVQIVGDKISEKVQTSMAQHKEVPDR